MAVRGKRGANGMNGSREEIAPTWTLITSHGLVLLYIAANPDATIRQTADVLELSERRVADIIRDLTMASLIDVEHRGRRNHYRLSPDARFQHPFVSDIPFDDFLRLWQRVSSKNHPEFSPNRR